MSKYNYTVKRRPRSWEAVFPPDSGVHIFIHPQTDGVSYTYDTPLRDDYNICHYIDPNDALEEAVENYVQTHTGQAIQSIEFLRDIGALDSGLRAELAKLLDIEAGG